uniref:Non-cysteinic peptide Bs 10 n=1 Tax=Hottentotta tamulus sindicus TaxID=42519 RepID=NDB_HOTTS|nr:RecName: Full=Non-cysteinic peptide Bs 10; Short=Bs10; AltName: Full=Non-disulfide-bridged peptide 2.1; Short=NDBP-2.1 [Mesobuthus tamulus sindicus]
VTMGYIKDGDGKKIAKKKNKNGRKHVEIDLNKVG